MNTTQTLQEIINKRAAERLDKDLKAICDFVRGNRLLANTDSGMPLLTFYMEADPISKERQKKTTTPFWAFQYRSPYNASSVYMDDLHRFWLPVYIEEETSLFLKKIEDVRKDVDYLLDKSEQGETD